VTTTKRLLILGPSYKRQTNPELLQAIERYDGVFFRVTRKNKHGDDTKVLILTENLTLLDANDRIPFMPPKGGMWDQSNTISHQTSYISKMRLENSKIIGRTIDENNIEEIFVAMGAIFRKALPDFSEFNTRVILPHGGLCPTAKSLKQWLQNSLVQ